MTNNKRVISTFKFGCPHLTLNEGPKVKSDHTRRFPAHDFLLYVGLPSQTSRTNNKRVIGTFTFGYPRLTLKEGPKVHISSPCCPLFTSLARATVTQVKFNFSICEILFGIAVTSTWDSHVFMFRGSLSQKKDNVFA